MKLKLDENIPLDAVVAMRRRGIDADTVVDEQLAGAGAAVAVAEAVDVGADGLVHVRPLPGQVNAERLAAASRRT